MTSSNSDTTPLLPSDNTLSGSSIASSPIVRIPKALFSIITTLSRGLLYTAKYSTGAYLGSRLSVTPNYAILRTGLRDRYVLLQGSVDFPIFHEPGKGLPSGFKVYRMRKGWRAGFLGWDAQSYTGSRRKSSWDDVTPGTHLQVSSSGTKMTYCTETTATASPETVVTPSRSIAKEIANVDLNELADKDAKTTNANTKKFSAVTHVSVHVPVDRTPDGFYRFVVTDANDKVLIVTPEYTLHHTFISFGILRGSSIPAMPIQFVGYIIKNAIAGVVSAALAALYFTGGLEGGLAIKIFMWFYKKEVEDAKAKAWQFARERGAVKPLDYLARGAGGGLPGSTQRFHEYEQQWDGKMGSWVVADVERRLYQ